MDAARNLSFNANTLVIGFAAGSELFLLKTAAAVSIVELPSDALFDCALRHCRMLTGYQMGASSNQE